MCFQRKVRKQEYIYKNMWVCVCEKDLDTVNRNGSIDYLYE